MELSDLPRNRSETLNVTLTHGGGCGSVAADRILLAVGDGAHVDGLHFTVF